MKMTDEMKIHSQVQYESIHPVEEERDYRKGVMKETIKFQI
jgi:hypothetical protein